MAQPLTMDVEVTVDVMVLKPTLATGLEIVSERSRELESDLAYAREANKRLHRRAQQAEGHAKWAKGRILQLEEELKRMSGFAGGLAEDLKAAQSSCRSLAQRCAEQAELLERAAEVKPTGIPHALNGEYAKPPAEAFTAEPPSLEIPPKGSSSASSPGAPKGDARPADAIKAGDVVALVTGGPHWTVEAVENGVAAVVRWIVFSYVRGQFPVAALVKVA